MPTPDFRPEAGGKFHPVDYQLKHHVASWAAIKANPRIWGAFVWLMFDCGSDNRREGARDGLNDKGLVAFDHRPVRPAYEFYRREWNRPAAASARMTVVATNDFQAAIDAMASRRMRQCVKVPFRSSCGVTRIGGGTGPWPRT